MEPFDRREWLVRLGLLALLPGSVEAQASSPHRASEAASPSPGIVYDLRHFGAVGDGETNDTGALQQAIDRCSAAGGGIVFVPSGTFLIGTTELKSHVTLHLSAGAVLLGSGDGRHYRPVTQIPLSGDATLNDGNHALLYAVEAVGFAIEGSGTIDGNGARFHRSPGGPPAPAGLEGERRPHHLLLYRCRNVRLSHFHLRNSAYHSVRIIASEHLSIDSLSIDSRVTFNNDGFHLVSCTFVTISNCIVICKDDACAMFGSCSNVMVTNSFFRTRWSVFRFGGGAVRNIAVTNCVLSEVYGCPIKLQGNPGSTYENLSFSNLLFDDVTGPIHLGAGPSAKWNGSPGGPAEPMNGIDPATGAPAGTVTPAVVRNLSFSHIRGVVNTHPPRQPDDLLYPGEGHSSIILNCVPGATMEDISFDSIHLTFGGGGTEGEGRRRDLPQFASEYFLLGPSPAYGLYARGVDRLSLSNIRFRLATPDARPAIVLDSVRDVQATTVSVAGDPGAEAAMRLANCHDLLLSGVRLTSPAAALLMVEGDQNKSIVLDGADAGMAGVPAKLQTESARRQTRLRIL